MIVCLFKANLQYNHNIPSRFIMALNIYIASIKKKKFQSSPLPQRLRHFGQHLSRVHLFLLLHKYALYIFKKNKKKTLKIQNIVPLNNINLENQHFVIYKKN